MFSAKDWSPNRMGAHMRSEEVIIHGPDGFSGMRKAGRLAASVLDMITPHVVAGVTTQTLDQICHDYILAHDHSGSAELSRLSQIDLHIVKPCRLPRHTGAKSLREGDILNIDITVILDGWYGDTSRMFFVGTPAVKAQRLTNITYDCLMRGIDAARAGNTLGDIGYAIQAYAETHRYSVVRDFTGHGLRQVFHTAPTVLHYGNPGDGLRLQTQDDFHH